VVGRDLLEQRRLDVGHEEPEALLEVAGLRPLGMGGGAGAMRAACTPVKRHGASRLNRQGQEFIVEVQHDAVVLEEP